MTAVSRRWRLALTIAVAALAGSTMALPPGDVSAGPSTRRTGTVVVHEGGRENTSQSVDVRTYSVLKAASEPTIGIDHRGSIFYAATDTAALNATEILESKNGGATWDKRSPRLAGMNAHPLSLDPYVYVDRLPGGKSSRMFTIDLTVACSHMSYSDDGGTSWTHNPIACGRPVNDHQTLFSGPPVSSPTVGYPHIVYYCWNDVATSSCSKSLDGGVTFHPTGSPAFVGYEPEGQGSGLAGLGACGGLHGHGVVDGKGNVYLPREFCERPFLAISRDEGKTWERIRIANRGVNGWQGAGANPSVDVDAKGNIYYGWVAEDRLPYVSVSKDSGKSWSKPVMVAPKKVTEVNLFTLTVGEPGKLAFAYMGSETSPFQKCRLECTPSFYTKTTWNGYLGMSAEMLQARPQIFTGTVNHPSDPLKRRLCGPGRCGTEVLDFLDVEIGLDGVPYAPFVDACVRCDGPDLHDQGNEGLLAKLVGGPRLRR